jgi:SAM-dependent methyltransferase
VAALGDARAGSAAARSCQLIGEFCADPAGGAIYTEPMTTCPFCASAGSEWGNVHGHIAYECESCGVQFFPRPIAVSADYDNYYPYLAAFDGKRFAGEVAVRRPKFRHQLDSLRRHSATAHTLLDIGAGPGYFCKVANELGWDARGVETSTPAREAGIREFSVRYTDLQKVATQSQDVITCHHVLEHIEQPADFLRVVRGKLRPGGLLEVHVPNCEPASFAIRNFLDRSLGTRVHGRRCQLYYPEHISGFDTRSLPKALLPFGFDCIKVQSVSMWSPYHDPFFLANYFRGGNWLRGGGRAARHAVRSLVDKLGDAAGRGSWVVGLFRAA